MLLIIGLDTSHCTEYLSTSFIEYSKLFLDFYALIAEFLNEILILLLLELTSFYS